MRVRLRPPKFFPVAAYVEALSGAPVPPVKHGSSRHQKQQGNPPTPRVNQVAEQLHQLHQFQRKQSSQGGEVSVAGHEFALGAQSYRGDQGVE